MSMRPNPQHGHAQGEPGRIIRLGDVRRRRAARKRAPDRQYLAALLLLAAVGWAIWLTVFLTVPPSRLLTYLAFLAPLGIAVTATGALVAYAVDWHRGFAPSLLTCGRRGGLAAGVIVLNLALGGAHRWSVFVGAGSLVASILVDVVLARRDR